MKTAPAERRRLQADICRELKEEHAEDNPALSNIIERNIRTIIRLRRTASRERGLQDRIADLMCTAPLPIATEVIRGVNAWNGVGALALCTVPALMLR